MANFVYLLKGLLYRLNVIFILKNKKEESKKRRYA
jgi:hypothetical protein